jgi:hypothetical protein
LIFNKLFLDSLYGSSIIKKSNKAMNQRKAQFFQWHGPARSVIFVPKRLATLEQSWQAFGGLRADFDRWIPEACGILSLKMIADTYGLAPHLTPFALTKRCVDLGGFIEMPDGSIKGVFHRPLLTLAQELGLHGEVSRSLTAKEVAGALWRSHFVLLSIDLAKVRSDLAGSHIILVHGVDENRSFFLVHDSAEVLGVPGSNIVLPLLRLQNISNRRGIILWR